MLKGPVRIVPQWRELKCQLIEKLQKGLPEVTEGTHILLSDRPIIIFRESCSPNVMPLICYYSTDTEYYFASFTWRRSKKSKVRVWMYNMEDEAPVAEKEYAVEEDPKVLTIAHIPHVHLFVAYCDDIHLRFFSDHTQDFKLLSEVSSPYSITSMCSNPKTGELVTGAIGILAFWSFVPGEIPYMGVTQEVCIASGEFVHFLSVEHERRALVALCENIILVYDYQTKSQIRTFQVSPGVSLTCCSANWSQSFLYTGDLAGDVKVWNFDKGSQITQFKAHLSAITSIISRISVHTLMTASLDGLLKEWNLTTCELLRRVDIGEELFQMQFINEQTFFLRTQYTFSIRSVNNFYQLFNRTKSILKKLVRVQCGPDKARILATTEDGVIRFLSSVTGEMLFVTWPFQLLEKALDYVYDPDREELLVTMGTNDIYVLDTTKNPCPAKYILRATDSMDDKVLCLAYSRLDVGGRTSSFIFSGYKSGKVRTITQHLYRMGGRKLHDGNVVALSSISASGNLSYHSRESSYLCSYGIDEYIILSNVILKKNSLLEVVPLVVIPSTNCRINNLLLIPGYICVLTEQNRVRLWRQASLVPGKKNPFWKETDAMHSTSITSFDYCHTLSMLVTGGSDGSVRIWDILGQMLVEFDTSLKFSRVCFANQRGDLVVGCNMNIYFIPCVFYLPREHLSTLASRCVIDDVVERPLPFLPHFLLTFEIVFVPKYRQVGKQSKKYERLEPISNHKEVVIEKNVAKVVEFIGKEASSLPGPDFYGISPALKELHPEFAVEYQLIQQQQQQTGIKISQERKHVPAEPPLVPPPYRGLPPVFKSVPMLSRIPFQAGRSWPIAPDGYVPNSVVRAQLFPKGTPSALQCSLLSHRYPLPKRKMVKIQLPEWDKSEITDKARKKVQQRRRAPSLVEGPHRRRDLLSEIVSKPWLRHKPSDNTLPCVMKAILDLMDDVPYSTYLLCTAALVQLSESYPLPHSIQEGAFDRLILDTNHKEVRMRLAAWEALGKMDLLSEQEVVPLARALLDDNKKVRDLARSLLDSVAGITDKFVLKKEMQRLAEFSLEDLSEMGRMQDVVFPRRVRAAGIIAETQDEAVYALTEGAERLMNRVENQLTANLFLMTECPPKVTRRTSRPPSSRRRMLSGGPTEEFASPDAHSAAQARWLGLFGRSERKSVSSPAPHIEAKQLTGGEKLPRIQQARGKSVGVPLVGSSGASLLESSRSSSSTTTTLGSATSTTSSSSTSSTSSGSTWREVRRARRELRAKEKQHGPKALPTSVQDTQKVAKVRRKAHPILLQRRDTRTQLYTEMLKRQKVRKEEQATAPVVSKQESSVLPMKPSQPVLPVLPPLLAKGSLIDPKRQYSSDKSKWRNDLYKLMTLRIAPSVEGRTAAEDLLASARYALGGRAMSWEAFTNISQSLLTSQEKITAEADGWKKYMEDLFKTSLKEPWLPSSVESMETVVAAVKGREALSSSEMDIDSTDISREELTSREKREAAAEKRIAMGKKGLEPGARLSKEARAASEKEVAGKVAEKERKVAEREGKAVKGKEHDALKGREREAAKGREREAAKAREQEAAKAREREVAKGRERELAKHREREVAERKEKRKGGKLADKGGEELEGPELARKEVRKALLSESERQLVMVTDSMLAEVRAKAKERMLAELKERALAEARKVALQQVKERALADAKEMALAEARDAALLKAQKMAMAEAWEKVMAEARRKAQEEAEARVQAEAREIALAEGKEGEAANERIKELIRSITLEVDEARVLELAKELALEVDEARVLELAKELALGVDEARLLELAEARAAELAEAIAEQLVEAKTMEMSEAKIMELVEEKAQELAKARLRELAMEEERERDERRKGALYEEEEEGEEEEEMWEDLGEEGFGWLSEEERAALIAMWEGEAEEEQPQGAERDLSKRAHLLLGILTEPEKLEATDSTTFQRLFQVVSMLQVPSATEAEGLAEALLEKAMEIVKEGEGMQKLLSAGSTTVLAQLKEAVEAHQPWNTDPQEFAARMRTLLKTALTVLRARNLKAQLWRGAGKQAWWEKAKKEWVEEEDKLMGKRAFLDKKLKDAMKKWRTKKEKAEQERMELQRKERRLQFRSRPIVLGVSEKGKCTEEEQEEQKRADVLAHQRQSKLTWSLGAQRHKAWKAIVQMEELPPTFGQQAPIIRPKKYQLPQDFLYKATKPTTRIPRRKLRRGAQQHIFRLDEKKGIDWEKFTKLYQSLVSLKEIKGAIDSAAWKEQTAKLLDLYGVSNPLIQAMTQQLLMGGLHQRKYIKGSPLKVRKAQANLGERILYEMIHHSVRLPPKTPTLHSVFPLSYQNNVHPSKIRGITRFGTLSLKWKTFLARGKGTKLRLYVHSNTHCK